MFDIIQGGRRTPTKQPPDWRARWQQLMSIKKTLFLRHGSKGPRTRRAMFLMLCASAGVMGLFVGLDRFGFVIHAAIFYGVPLVFGLLVYLVFMAHSSIPRTWTIQLGRQLAEYDPLDLEAYRGLQQKTRDLGWLDFELVNRWMDFECRAVESAAGLRNIEADVFLNKKI